MSEDAQMEPSASTILPAPEPSQPTQPTAPTAPADGTADAAPTAPPLSKNAQKRLAKAAWLAEKKRERRAAEKERKKEKELRSKREAEKTRGMGGADLDDEDPESRPESGKKRKHDEKHSSPLSQYARSPLKHDRKPRHKFRGNPFNRLVGSNKGNKLSFSSPRKRSHYRDKL